MGIDGYIRLARTPHTPVQPGQQQPPCGGGSARRPKKNIYIYVFIEEGGRRVYEIINIDISEITVNEEAGRELMCTSNQSSTPVKWHSSHKSTHNTALT